MHQFDRRNRDRSRDGALANKQSRRGHPCSREPSHWELRANAVRRLGRAFPGSPPRGLMFKPARFVTGSVPFRVAVESL